MASGCHTWCESFTVQKPWADVMRAAQVKYPNPFNSNILSVDVLSRTIDPSTGALHTFKIINSSWPMFSNSGELKAVEHTVVDPCKRHMVLESNNVDLRGILKASERLEYEAHPENEDWTLLRHTISIDAFPLIAYPALKLSKSNAHLGRDALVWAVENRVNNFMGPVERLERPEHFLDSDSSVFRCKSTPPSTSTRFSSILDRVRSLKLGGLVGPLVARAISTPNADASSSYTRDNSANRSSGPVSSSMKTVLSAFDLFNPSNIAELTFSSLESKLEKVSADMNTIGDTLKARRQRVASSFSKVDEYFLII